MSFLLHSFCGKWGDLDTVNRFNHTSLVAVHTPIDHHKSVSNRCVIENFGGVYVVTLLSGIYRGCIGFCVMTESDPFIFFQTVYNIVDVLWHFIICFTKYAYWLTKSIYSMLKTTVYIELALISRVHLR